MSARFAVLVLGGLVATATAQEPPAPPPAEPTVAEPVATAPAAAVPDTSGWTCKFCPFDDGTSGWFEPAAGFVSDPSFRFGDFTGLEEDGGFAALSGLWRYRDADTGSAWDLRVANSGLDSGTVAARGGRQGRYRVSLDYELLEHLRAADARTPFDGGRDLNLPAGWTEGGSTGGMTALDASLRTLPMAQRRVRSALGFVLTPRPEIDLRLDYRRDEISGTGVTGGSFLTLAAELPRPVDQTVDRVDASAAYAFPLAHARLSLSSSSFSNGIDALAWENPYSGPSAAARDGQMAQAPDNRASQLSLAVGTAPQVPVQLSGTISLGRMVQDQRFLPATVNPNEAVALPRSSLDGQVDTLRFNARAILPVVRGFRLTADVLRDDRDNRTPVAAYTQVVMDTFTGAARTSAPYGYTRDRWRLGFERRGVPRVGVGVDENRVERRLFGTASTTERTAWARASWRPFEGGDLRLKAATSERSGSEFAGAGGVPQQNALMRAFNTAARSRDEIRADFSLGWAGALTAFNLAWADDDYPDSALGRTGGRDLGYGTDLMLQLRADLAFSAFASHRQQESAQAGSESFGAPDWSAQLEDTTNVVGAHFEWQGPRGLELGGGYTLATSEGAISMLAPTGTSGFPLLVTRWHDARVFARYPLEPGLTLRVDLLREIYEASDWSLTGPDTVPNLLSLGQGTQEGSVTAIMLGVRWQF